MITLDAADPTPPYEQIRSRFADLILTGRLSPGARLPSVRQLAGDLRIAPGTVARAYTELESAGLVSSSRAGGTRVAPGHGLAPDAMAAAQTFVHVARSAGLDLERALAAVRSHWPA